MSTPLKSASLICVRAALSVAVGAALPTWAETSMRAETPTLARDVAPLLDEHCVSCHRAGGIGAKWDFTAPESTRPWAATIGREVTARRMPPWPADSAHSMKFRNDNHLSDAQIATIEAWVAAGAPPGDEAQRATRAARSASVWGDPGGRAPDAILSLPEVHVPADGEVPYVLQRIKVPLTHDRWIVAMQVRPGNGAVVHHMGITEVTMAAGIDADQLRAFSTMAREIGMPDGSLSAMRPAVADPDNPGNYDMLGVYTPGTTFERFADGTAKLLKAGGDDYINFNVHYSTTGTPQTDRSQLALWLSNDPPQHQLFRAPAAVATLIANGRQLLEDDPGTKAEGTRVAIPAIGANQGDYELIGMTAVTRPMTLYQLQPHAHMRGRDFTYAVMYPDGREAVILSVPRYDFHWQLAYELERPLTLPAGSKLIVTAHYDNSSRNEHLRNLGAGDLARNCGPDKLAYFRRENQSWHEMFSPLVQYSIDRSAPAAATARLVRTVGCLIDATERRWRLRAAARFEDATLQSTTAVEVQHMAQQSLGTGAVELIGAGMFAPRAKLGRKVAVKGVLVGSGDDARLNVTSLQQAGGRCS